MELIQHWHEETFRRINGLLSEKIGYLKWRIDKNVKTIIVAMLIIFINVMHIYN